MLYDRKQARKAERQRGQMARAKRIRIEKAAPALLKACKIAQKAVYSAINGNKKVLSHAWHDLRRAIEQAEEQ